MGYTNKTALSLRNFDCCTILRRILTGLKSHYVIKMVSMYDSQCQRDFQQASGQSIISLSTTLHTIPHNAQKWTGSVVGNVSGSEKEDLLELQIRTTNTYS